MAAYFGRYEGKYEGRYYGNTGNDPPPPPPPPEEGVAPGAFIQAVNTDVSFNATLDVNRNFQIVKEKSSREKADDAQKLYDAAQAAEIAARAKEQRILGEIAMLKAQAEQAQGRAGIYGAGAEKLDAKLIKLQAELAMTKRAHQLEHARRVALHRKMVEDDEDDAMTMLATMLLH